MMLQPIKSLRLRDCWIFVLITMFVLVGCQTETPERNIQKPERVPQSELVKLILQIDTLSTTNGDSCKVLVDSLEQLSAKQQYGFGLTKALLYKSKLSVRSGNRKQAFDYLTKAYELADSLQIDTLTSDVHNAFGIYYDVSGKPDKAIDEFRRSMTFIRPNMYKRLSRAYCNLGYCYEHKDELYTAFRYLQKGLNYAKMAHSKSDEASCYLGMGVVKALEGSFDTSIHFSGKAEALFRSQNNLYYLKDVQMNLGSAFIQIPEVDSALYWYKKALMTNKTVKDSLRLPVLYEAISLAYRDINDYKNAHLYLDSSLYAERDAFKIQQTKAIAEAEAKFKVDLKNKNIQLLSKEKELQHNHIRSQRLWIAILSLIAVLMGVVALFFIRNNALKRRKHEILELQHAHQLVLQSQLELDNLLLQQENLQSRYNNLKSQISPHFLFNSLNSLNGLIMKDSELAVKFVEELATVYRYLLKNNGLKLVEVAEEMKFVDAFFHLLKTRFGDSVELNVAIPVTVYGKFIPPFTLQLLIENAVKHNVIAKEKPLVIRITAEDEALVVRNNYQPKIQKLVSTKIGLSNIKKRYELLNRNDFHYGLSEDVFEVHVPVLDKMNESDENKEVGVNENKSV